MVLAILRRPRPGSDEPPFDPDDIGMSWREFVDRIKDCHSLISDLFGTGIGLRLQSKDSDTAQAIMLEFNALGALIVPVYDSSFVSGRSYVINSIRWSEKWIIIPV